MTRKKRKRKIKIKKWTVHFYAAIDCCLPMFFSSSSTPLQWNSRHRLVNGVAMTFCWNLGSSSAKPLFLFRSRVVTRRAQQCLGRFRFEVWKAVAAPTMVAGVGHRKLIRTTQTPNIKMTGRVIVAFMTGETNTTKPTLNYHGLKIWWLQHDKEQKSTMQGTLTTARLRSCSRYCKYVKASKGQVWHLAVTSKVHGWYQAEPSPDSLQ